MQGTLSNKNRTAIFFLTGAPDGNVGRFCYLGWNERVICEGLLVLAEVIHL